MTNIAYAQTYCTVEELIGDLGLTGDEPRLLDRIRAASKHILNAIGNFIPIHDTRMFYTDGVDMPRLGPLLSATSVTEDEIVLLASEYRLRPPNRAWLNGPYAYIEKIDTTIEPIWNVDGIAILGTWGLYEERADLGLTINQAINAQTMGVADGSLVSPGMVVLAGDEQELITGGNGGPGSPDGTLIVSQLTAAVSADGEVIGVTDGSEFHTGEVFRVEFEDLRVRRIAGNTLLCSRGWNGTTKTTHASGSAIHVYRTFAVSRAMNGTIAAAHVSAALSRFVIPEDVNWLCREVAGLMRMKAKVNFAAKSGNSDLGEAFYFNEFPRQIETIKNNYMLP